MDIVLVNGNLVIVDYLNAKETLICKKKGLFLKVFSEKKGKVYKELALKLNLYSLLRDKIIGHPYSLIYSSKSYVDYRDINTVSKLEEKVSKNSSLYEEYRGHEQTSFYFLNPIIYKKSLTALDKIGALLYFTSAVKCSATFHEFPHVKKFIPSNGARYPFKPVILVHDESVVPLKTGIYKYDMRSHALIRLGNYIQESTSNSVLSIIYCADVTRVMNRYPAGISYRDLLFDYGHLLDTLKKCTKHYGILDFLTLKCDNDNNIKAHGEQKLLELIFARLEIDSNFFVQSQ